MRILIVQDTDWLERNPITQHHLAELMSLRGHGIRVIDYEIRWKNKAGKKFYSKREIFSNIGRAYDNATVTVIRPGMLRLPILNYLSMMITRNSEIKKQIKEFKPDVVAGLGIITDYLLLKAAKHHGIPYVRLYIDVLHQLIPERLFRPLGKILVEKTLKEADAAIINSDKLKDMVLEMGAPSNKTVVLKSGIDIKRYNPNENGLAIREKYGIGKDDIVLFFMGWLYSFSGLIEVALQLSVINNPEIKLLIVGEGEAYKPLDQLREARNLSRQIILTGKRPYGEIPALISAGNVCIMPFLNNDITRDIVPIKIYEYLATGKPVVSTSLPGVVNEFGQDKGVVYVDAPEQIVEKALAIIRASQTEELGSKGRAFAEGCSWDKVADEFENILKQVSNGTFQINTRQMVEAN